MSVDIEIISNGSTAISETKITFTVLHRTDEPIEDIQEAVTRAWDGHAVGLDTDYVTTPVKDEDVPDRLVDLGNDGTFFDYDLGKEEEF